MSLLPRLRSRSPIQEEVVYFSADSMQYYAITKKGRRINIIRSRSYQPPIVEEEDFMTYLWVEALEGFFLFSQRFERRVPGPWILEEEFVPEEPENFFFDFFDKLGENLAGGEK